MSTTRPLVVVDASDPIAVMDALRQALFHDGPALLPRLGGAQDSRTAPFEVPADAAVVIETSGTTGKPKRVWLSADALIASAQSHLDTLGGPGVWWLTLPTSYIAGVQVLTRSLLAQRPPVVSPPGPFGPGTLLAVESELRKGKDVSPVYAAMVPAQMQRLVDAARHDAAVADALRVFDAVLVGGQALPQRLIEGSAGLGVRMIRTYGSAETAGGCVWDGRPLAGVTVGDIDGRLAISGPILAGGYLDDPVLTGKHFAVLDGVRWYVTDDQGGVSADGTVSVVGRVDDVIVSGGKKVSLADVERILVDELGCVGCVVTAGNHDEWGQVPVIVGVTGLDLDRAREIIGARLGAHARPDRFVLVPEIPLLGSGKPDRVALSKLVSR
jgi:O-succinylbenzoic acid--CoA ligase